MDIYELAIIFLSKNECTHKKLQKLCYYAQALHLAIFGEALVDSEFEAWRHGPVSPELYRVYRDNGSRPINNDGIEEPNVSENDKKFIDLVYNIYGELTANQLESLSHSEEPWISARKDNGKWDASNNIISKDCMRDYYKKVLKRYID